MKPRNASNRIFSSDLKEWATRLRTNPDDVLRLKGHNLPYSLLTTSELLRICEAAHRKRISRSALLHELKHAGFRKVYRGRCVRTELSGAQRLWAIRNCEKLHKIVQPFPLANVYDEERNAVIAQYKKEHPNENDTTN